MQNQDLFLTRKFLIKSYVYLLKKILKNSLKEIRLIQNDIEIKTTPNNIRSVLYFLKNHTLCNYKQIIEIACSDTPGKKRRFALAYLLYSLHYNTHINVNVQTDEVSTIPSVTPVFLGAG